MLAISSRCRSSSCVAAMGFPNSNRQKTGRQSASSSSSSSSSRVRRLDRRNASKNIDYEASSVVSWASDSHEDFSGVGGAVLSLDPLPASLSAFTNQTSFRIEGVDGEFDLLCRSLGLSGPEDFAIPADAWEACKTRSMSDSSLRSRSFDPSPDVVEVPPDSPLSAGVLVENSVAEIDVNDEEKNEPTEETKSNGGSTGSDGGIRGVRPPVLVPPALQNPPMSVPVQETNNSTWDLLKTFDVDDDIDRDEAMRRRSVCSKGKALEIHDRAVEGEEVRLGETIADVHDSCSSSTHGDDDLSSTTTETMLVISPNGRFKRQISSWMRGGLLGSGSFGTVYEGISDDGFFFAVKEVSLLDQGSNAKQCILQLEQEIALLSQFEHENIVQYFGTDKEDSKLYIFLELVTQGSLASLYQRYKLRDSQVSAYTRQILNGLNYLHERNVVHRDIKCANILVDASGSVKLADFGLAKEITKLNMLKSCKGSVYWMAPEVVNPKRTYGPAADIWSLGCTVLEMLTQQVPYPNLEWAQAFYKIGHGEPPEIPSSLSKDARDFIQRCVQVNPDERPSASQLLDHPFVQRPIPSSAGSSVQSSPKTR